jgi:Trefoil (P-type) domain
MYKRLFKLLLLILLSPHVSAQIYKTDECFTETTYIYGGWASCYAYPPSSSYSPGINIDEYFFDEEYLFPSSRNVTLTRREYQNCTGKPSPCDSYINYSCNAWLPFIRNSVRTTCTKSLIDPEVCSIPPQDRYDGGYRGISADQCKAREMCWDDSNAGTNWCYIPKGKCNIAPTNRIEAGWRGISESDCLNAGMCWNNSAPQTNWCYRPNPF